MKGGHIFLGDIRALEMLEPFHQAVQLTGSEDELSLAELAERTRVAITRDKELLLSIVSSTGCWPKVASTVDLSGCASGSSAGRLTTSWCVTDWISC